MTEVRTTSSTGGQKGTKAQRMGLLPAEALMKLSEIYAFGAEKYDDFNYRKGYPWHLSADALQRHFQLWNSGQDLDEESNLPHILHAAWHCLTLYMFSLEHPDFDDRVHKAKEQFAAELAEKRNEEAQAKKKADAIFPASMEYPRNLLIGDLMKAPRSYDLMKYKDKEADPAPDWIK